MNDMMTHVKQIKKEDEIKKNGMISIHHTCIEEESMLSEDCSL
jgi:hypothetical protein